MSSKVLGFHILVLIIDSVPKATVSKWSNLHYWSGHGPPPWQRFQSERRTFYALSNILMRNVFWSSSSVFVSFPNRQKSYICYIAKTRSQTDAFWNIVCRNMWETLDKENSQRMLASIVFFQHWCHLHVASFCPNNRANLYPPRQCTHEFKFGQ